MLFCWTQVNTKMSTADSKPSYDLQAHALFRIVFAGFLLFHYLTVFLPDYAEFFTDAGPVTRALNRALNANRGEAYSLLMLSDAPLWHALFNAVFVYGVFALLVGYRTSLAVFICLICFISFTWRNAMVFSGVERLSVCLLTFMLFAPLNRYWSVDAALQPGLRSAPVNKLGVYGLRIQVCLVYLVAGITKLLDKDWMAGTGLLHAFDDGVYGSVAGRDFGVAFPLLAFWLSVATVWFQVIFSLLAYSPWYRNWTRAFAIAGAFALHLGIMLFIHVGQFPLLCMTYLFLLIRDDWIDAALRRARARLNRLVVYYDPDCGFCERVCYLFREFCLTPTVQVLPSSANAEAHQLLKQHNSWVLFDGTTGQKRHLLKWEAVAFVLRQSPLFWIFGWLTDLAVIKKPMETFYDLIGRNRKLLGQCLAFIDPAKELPCPEPLKKMWRLLPAVFACVALVMAANALLPQKNKLPRSFSNALAMTNLYQRWNFFVSPRGSWFLYHLTAVPVELDKTIDLVPRVDVPCWRDAASHYIDCKEHRWERYFLRLTQVRGYEQAREEFARYLCARVEKNHGTPIKEIQVMFHRFSAARLAERVERPAFTRIYPCAGSEAASLQSDQETTDDQP